MVRIYHNLFIYDSADGYSGCFQFLANTNEAAVDSCVHVCEGIYPPARLSDC